MSPRPEAPPAAGRRLVISLLGGVIEHEISPEDAEQLRAAALELGPDFVEGDLAEDTLVLWAAGEDGRRIAPARLRWHTDGATPPPWHVYYLARLRHNAA